MSVLVVVTDRDLVRPILTLAIAVSNAKQQSLTVLCWSYSPKVVYPLLAATEDLSENKTLVDETQRVLDELGVNVKREAKSEEIKVLGIISPNVTDATLAEIRSGVHDVAIVDAIDTSADHKLGPQTQRLLRSSPCETIVFLRNRQLSAKSKRVLVLATDSPHDRAAFELFSHSAQDAHLKLTLARIEDDAGEEATELGRRELKRLMRDVGVKANGSVKRRVFSRDSWQEFLTTAQANDLVLVGVHQRAIIRDLCEGTTRPAIAVIKREPPLKRFTKSAEGRWKTKLSPADYADMMQGLRRGADLNNDFLIMLGLAAGIASLGLLQDSPAVVIGSMLLAPLMTPMIACGLAIAQGNKKLGRRSMISIGVGFVLTLLVSLLVGLASPGEELTLQIVARGDPNILDLMVALLSSAAAAYALARPNIIGAVAGVAIATALVPPLCSAGISLAYREYLNAHGAALLFATNLVAIILGAAVTFRLLGVTVAKAGVAEQRWVYRITAAICLSLILLAFPLQRRLDKRIELGQSQPRTYPLTKATEQALANFIKRSPEIELVASGRPSTLYDHADVVLILSSPEPLRHDFSHELVEICRQEMGDPELVVEVHCFLNAWKEEDL